MRRERAEALLSANNDLTRFAEAEHVGILAAETYFPAQYVSIFSIGSHDIKANTSRFGGYTSDFDHPFSTQFALPRLCFDCRSAKKTLKFMIKSALASIRLV